jgi:bifunctional non-homologous end joining protein LigD
MRQDGRVRPMLATRGTYVPPGDEWQHEVKWDGVRILADVTVERGVRLFSRNENIVSAAWPEIVISPAGHDDLLVDGEIIGLNAEGRPDFGVLQPRMHVRNTREVARLAAAIPATYMVFDLLRLDGADLTRAPLHERRAALAELDLQGTSWAVPPVYDDGAMLHEATLQQGLEGMVSKRRSSRYEFGARSKAWLKFPHRRRASFVIGGWRLETDSQNRIGALLVGEPIEGGGFIYRGRVGSGIAGAKARKLEEVLAPLARDTSPFSDEVPRVDALGTRWVEPVLVVDVESLGLSSQQRLRQPAYQGLRTDLDLEDLLL